MLHTIIYIYAILAMMLIHYIKLYGGKHMYVIMCSMSIPYIILPLS